MTEKTPRIRAVTAEPPAILHITWRDGASATIDLKGWIVVGQDQLAALKSLDVFVRARIGLCGTMVTWDDDDGDLAIDAIHLERIAAEQRR